MLRPEVWYRFTDVLDVPASSTIRIFYQTLRRNIREDSHLLTLRRENLKYHQLNKLIVCCKSLIKEVKSEALKSDPVGMPLITARGTERTQGMYMRHSVR